MLVQAPMTSWRWHWRWLKAVGWQCRSQVGLELINISIISSAVMMVEQAKYLRQRFQIEILRPS
jgi:hypothetical protein